MVRPGFRGERPEPVGRPLRGGKIHPRKLRGLLRDGLKSRPKACRTVLVLPSGVRVCSPGGHPVLWPRVYVRIRPTYRNRRLFQWAVKKLCVSAEEIEVGQFECVGPAEALAELVGFPCIESFHT